MPVDTTPTSQDATIEAGERLPARFWWPRWLGIATAILIISIFLLRWGWDCYATAKLDATIAAIKARGEPFYPEDFNPPTVADKDNAASDYLAAAAALPKKKTESEKSWAWIGLLPLDEDEKTLLKRIVPDGQKSLALLRQGRQKKQADWGTRFYHPGTDYMPLPHLIEILELSHFARAAAVYQHELGNDAEAVELILDILALSHAMGQDPRIITNDCSISVAILASRTATEISWDLQIAPHPVSDAAATHPAAFPASRPQVLGLIAALLDESEVIPSRRTAAMFKRMANYDFFMGVLDGRFSLTCATSEFSWGSPLITGHYFRDWLVVSLFKPAIKQDLIHNLEYLTGNVWASEKTSLPDEKAISPSPAWLEPPRLANFFSRLIFNQCYGFRDPEYHGMATQRMAAITLALRVYQADHSGQRPGKLEDLVPKYLPVVPQDPCDPAHGSIRYIPTTQPAVVYSVGGDCRDDGGTVPADLATRTDDDWKSEPDVIVALDRVPRPQPVPENNPATHAAGIETPTTTAPASRPGEEK